MPDLGNLFECYLVHFLDKEGFIVTNLYVLAPTVQWVLNSLKGLLKEDYTVVVEMANNATFDSRLWRKEKENGDSSGT